MNLNIRVGGTNIGRSSQTIKISKSGNEFQRRGGSIDSNIDLDKNCFPLYACGVWCNSSMSKWKSFFLKPREWILV